MRVILHSDLNAFYASVECLYKPELRNIPMAVCGDPATRHGIVLAKNELAKKSGVKTGEAIWQALAKCPLLEIVAPQGHLYLQYSQLVRSIYEEYTPYIEPFGIDECWLDLTGAERSGVEIAEEIRRRIKYEIGLTVSIGVSFNKVFAKLGSDLKKPDAVSEIREDNFRTIVWPLPIRALLFVGRQTEKKLGAINVRTIGDLVRCGPDFLRLRLGKAGLMLWHYAMGLDRGEVASSGAYPQVKSIGNSMTAARDLYTESEVKQVLMRLTDEVASRLREQELCCTTVQISLRDSELFSWERQCKLERPTQCSAIILAEAMTLYKNDKRSNRPLRSLGVRTTDLCRVGNSQQISYLPELQEEERWLRLERTLDSLRCRFGNKAVLRACLMSD